MNAPTLWRHQDDAIRRARSCDNFALFFEVGCGKTLTMLKILEDKCGNTGEVFPTLILCPPIVIDNWAREISRFTQFSEKDVLKLKGTGKQRALVLSRLRENKIVITNYESLNMPDVLDGLLRFKPKILICDESHKLKDPKSKRAKCAYRLSLLASNCFILTGTPVVNSPFDLFSQFYVLDKGATLGRSFFEFRARFFYDENAGRPKQCYFPAWVPRTGALEEINELIKPLTAQAKKSQCLDLPPLVRSRVYCDLAEQQRKVYDQIEKDMLSSIGNKTVTTDMVLTQALRLQQMTSGFVRMDDETVYEFERNAKATALRELLSDLPDEKILIWCAFTQDYVQVSRVCDELGVSYCEVTGRKTEAQKAKAIEEFETRGNPRILIGHPASCGIGVNLTAASISIFYSRSFSLEHDIQAEARNYRGGSERHRSVTRIDIVAKDTIDEKVLDALLAKQCVADAILGEIKCQNS